MRHDRKFIFLAPSLVVLLATGSCGKKDEKADAADTTAPTAGGKGALKASNITATSLSILWEAAKDDKSAADKLQYGLFHSTTDNISALTEVKANGTADGPFVVSVGGVSSTGLTPATVYYFNVIVKDLAGNEAVYTKVTATTLAN